MRFSIDRITKYHQLAQRAEARRSGALSEFRSAKDALEAAKAALLEHQKHAHAVRPRNQLEHDKWVDKQDAVYAAVPEAQKRYDDAFENYRLCRDGPLTHERQWSAIGNLLREHPETPAAIRRLI